MQVGEQHRWWAEISSLAAKVGYRHIRQRYRDHQDADMAMLQNVIRRMFSSRYYEVDPTEVRRRAWLMSPVTVDFPQRAPTVTSPSLVSDSNVCGLDIADRCGRPSEPSFMVSLQTLIALYKHVDLQASRIVNTRNPKHDRKERHKQRKTRVLDYNSSVSPDLLLRRSDRIKA